MVAMKATVFITICAFCIAPVYADPLNTRVGVITDSIKDIPSDLHDMWRAPFDHSNEAAAIALGIGALIALDKPITQFYQQNIEQPLSGFKVPDAPGPFKNMGTGGTDGWLALGIMGTYAGGLIADDSYTQSVGIAAGKAVAYSIVLDQVLLKSLFGRKRPLADLKNGQPDGTYTDNPFDFGNSRKMTMKSDQYGSAFPSYHFTMWFAVAEVYKEAYGSPWLPYLAAAVGLGSNIQGHRHWVSDMVAGGLLGTWIGSTVAHNTFNGRKKGATVMPYSTGSEMGLQVGYAL